MIVQTSGAYTRHDVSSNDLVGHVVAFAGILDLDGRVIEVSQTALSEANLRSQEVIGLPLWDTFWFSHDQKTRRSLMAAVEMARSGQLVRFGAEARISDRETIAIELQISPSLDAAGNTVQLVPLAVEISRLGEAEPSSDATRGAFEEMIGNAPFGIMIINADLRMPMVSAGAMKAWEGYDRVLGRDLGEFVRELWPADLAEEIIGHYRHTLETGEPYESRSTHDLRVDTGAEEAYDWRIYRQVLPDGRLGVVCHFYDLSQARKYEARILDQENKFRSTFEGAAVGLAHVAQDGKWLRVNSKICDVLGYSREELAQKTFQDITHPDDLDADLELLDRLASGTIDEYCMRKRYFHRDGRIVWANLSVAAVREAGGGVAYYISSLSDITVQKIAEDQRDMLVEELNHRVKNILATVQSVASHTMRTARSLEDFSERFSGRLQAISKTHDAIFDALAGGIDLTQLVRNQFDIYFEGDNDRLHLSGAPLEISAQIANILGMVLHELLTNAIKYGALSVDSGAVSLKWTESAKGEQPTIRLRWKELGGPPISQPKETGFGSRLMKMMITQTLHGRFETTFAPAGLICDLEIPISSHAVSTGPGMQRL